MPSLVCHRLCFTWPTGEVVFDDLTAAFPEGRTGLIGRNGSGKSTLLALLAGLRRADRGSVERPAVVGYLPQDPATDPDSTVADLLGVADRLAAVRRIVAEQAREGDWDLAEDAWDLEDRTAVQLAELGLDGVALDRTAATLSGGQVMLIALAGRLLARPDVLLLDEPTNNLDRPARARLRAALATWRGPLVVISHDRELLAEMDAIAELRPRRLGATQLRIFGGNLEAYEAQIAVEQEAALQAVRTAKADLRRQQRELVEAQTKIDRRVRYGKGQESGMPTMFVNQLKGAAELSAAKLRGSAQDDVAEAREQVERAEERVREDASIVVDLPATTVPAGRDVVLLEEVVLRNGVEVSLHVRGPERLGLTGPNGVGKTTLIDTVRGVIAPRSGLVELKVPHRLLPQRLRLLDDDETVLGGVSRMAPETDQQALRRRLAQFLLPADTVQRAVATLSGGERFRASLAALLLAEPAPQLLILDEPTNNLDLDSVRQLTEALRSYRGALLVSSHDETFLDALGLTGRVQLDPVTGASLRPW